MTKLLISLITYDGYLDLVPKIWDRLKQLNKPEGWNVDYLLVTEDTELETISFSQTNSIPYSFTSVDYSKLDGYTIDINEYNLVTFANLRYIYEIAEMRNHQLQKAKEETLKEMK